jgi:two-component system response regulator CpxR
MIDDDVELCELVGEYLRREGMEVLAVHDGESGARMAVGGGFAVAVLDVMLPGIGGFEVLRRLRSAPGPGARLPVLMLTARGDEVDRVLGLELGADDYLPKPFSSRELVARIRAILRRARAEPLAPLPDAIAVAAPGGEQVLAARGGRREVLRVGDVEMEASTRRARRGGELIELTSAEWELLQVLLRAHGEIVSRDSISREAMGRALLPYDRSIDVHVSNLRRKLGPAAHGGERIKSVRGIGYLYVAEESE